MSCLCVTEGRPEFMPWLVWNFEKQNYPDAELIVIDSSKTPWKAPEDKRIQIVSAPPGASVADKRNTALGLATGGVICWFDDDDWQHPSRLSLLVEALRGGALAAGGLHSWFVHLWTGQARAHRGRGPLLFNGAGFRAPLARAVSFDSTLSRASDTPWLREVLARAGGAPAILEPPLHLWLSHDTNLSNPAGRQRFELPLSLIADRVGAEAWQDTETQLSALRERLGGSAPLGSSALRASAGEAALRVSALERPRPLALRRLLEEVARSTPGLAVGPSFAPGAPVYLALSPAEVPLAAASRAVVVVGETLLDAALRRALSRAAAVVALGEPIADWLTRKGMKRPQLVLSCPADLGLRPREALGPRFTVGLYGADRVSAPPGCQDVLGRSIAGRPLYGLDLALSALERLRGEPVAVLLDPRLTPDSATHRRLSALGLEVEVAAALDASFYARIDALVVGSVHEAGPAEALDALCAGVPALTRNPLPLDDLERWRWEDAEQLEAHLRALLADREGSLAAGPERRAQVEAHLAERAPAERAALLELLGGAPVTPARPVEPLAPRRAQAPAAAPAARKTTPYRNIEVKTKNAPLPAFRPAPADPGRLLSVLMTAWATAPWIGEAAASILGAELPPGWSLELLIAVDDCPDTLAAARRVQDRRVTVFDLEQNGGTYRALNTLLRFARGEAIAVMDSDDVAEPHRLRLTLERLYAPDAPGLVSAQFLAVDEDGAPLGPPSAVPADPMPGFLSSERCFLMPHGAMVARHALYDALGGYDDTRVSGDADLIIRALASGWRGVTLPDVVLRYRQRRGPQLTRAQATRRGSPLRAAYEAELQARWARYRLGERPEPLAEIATSPLRAVHHGGPPRVEVILPTVPWRLEGARTVIEALLPQGIARLVVLLNGHTDARGLPEDPRIVYRLLPAGTGPAARLDEPTPEADVVLFVDDDLLYPPDYVAHTLAQLAALGPGCALSYHAARWPPGARRYLDREALPYTEGRTEPTEVSYLGTGVSALPAELLPLVRGPRPPIMEINDDLWISARLQAAGVRLMRAACPSGWIKATELANAPEALYRQAVADRFRVREDAMRYASAVLGWRMERPATPPAPAAAARRR